MNSSSTAKTILFWISIVFLGVMLWRLVSANTQTPREDTPSYSEFMARVETGSIWQPGERSIGRRRVSSGEGSSESRGFNGLAGFQEIVRLM